METQPKNPEFRNNPENFHPCIRLWIKGLTHWCHCVSLCKNFYLLLSTGSTWKNRKNTKNCYWDVKHQHKQTKVSRFHRGKFE